MRELETLKSERVEFEKLIEEVAHLESFSILDNLSPEDEAELEKGYAAAEAQAEAWEFKTLLGGEYDRRSALVTIRSGAGGVDAQSPEGKTLPEIIFFTT